MLFVRTQHTHTQISLGTVTTVEEAVQWLSYTYLFIRMRANPLVYGIRQDYWEVKDRTENLNDNSFKKTT